MELISVIIPVYNVERYLERCLDSVVNQTYKNLEIILIDDGSSDGSGEICDKYAKLDKRIIVIHQNNSGVSAARNKGIDIAKGDYISFIDSDDTIEANMYEILLKNAVESGAEISYCGFSQIELNGEVKYINNTLKKIILEKKEVVKGYFFNDAIKLLMYCPWNKLFSKKILKTVRYREDLAIGEDILFVFECIRKANYLCMEDVCLYNYMKRENSAMTSSFSDKRMHYIIAAEEIEKICRDEFPYAVKEAGLWVYMHKLNICRQLLCNPIFKKKYQKEFNEYKTYLRNSKKEYYHLLNWKRKLDYVFVFYFPIGYVLKRGLKK